MQKMLGASSKSKILLCLLIVCIIYAASMSNSWFNTLHGIDVAGRRLAEEVRSQTSSLKTFDCHK